MSSWVFAVTSCVLVTLVGDAAMGLRDATGFVILSGSVRKRNGLAWKTSSLAWKTSGFAAIQPTGAGRRQQNKEGYDAEDIVTMGTASWRTVHVLYLSL